MLPRHAQREKGPVRHRLGRTSGQQGIPGAEGSLCQETGESEIPNGKCDGIPEMRQKCGGAVPGRVPVGRGATVLNGSQDVLGVFNFSTVKVSLSKK